MDSMTVSTFRSLRSQAFYDTYQRPFERADILIESCTNKNNSPIDDTNPPEGCTDDTKSEQNQSTRRLDCYA